jgi:hypothetical protein
MQPAQFATEHIILNQELPQAGNIDEHRVLRRDHPRQLLHHA